MMETVYVFFNDMHNALNENTVESFMFDLHTNWLKNR